MEKLIANLGFKGERGYSAYEVAVKNGFEGTEQDWLATLGTTSHLTQNKATYTAAESQTTFDLPETYVSGDYIDVYVNGLRLNSNQYTVNEQNSTITISSTINENDIVEVVESSMSTNELPIVTTINDESTDDTAPATKSVYNFVTNKETTLNNSISTLNTTISNFCSEFQAFQTNIFKEIYPVGSIYMSVNSTNPSILFGGTWEQLEDKFLLGAGNTYTAGTTGGEATHTLTIAETPQHRHNLNNNGNTNLAITINAVGGGNNYNMQYSSGASENGPYILTSYVGGGQAHNNMPPYLTVYMWKRTAL